jgi:hypothetical protein
MHPVFDVFTEYYKTNAKNKHHLIRKMSVCPGVLRLWSSRNNEV